MTNLFQGLSDKELDKLKRILRSNTITYPKNINILSNMNRDDFIAIIESGSISFIFNDYDGNKTILDELSEGEVFGSLTYSLNNEELSCITKEDTQITYIEYDQITNDEIIKNDFYIIFIKNLIKVLNSQINKRTTRDKLLGYFKQISQTMGSKTFIMPITYTELAAYLSVDRSSMMRELGYLKEEGFIKTTGKRVTILY